MKDNKVRFLIVSDVSERDGIGIEFYLNDELIAEIFRNDAEKNRTLQTFKENVSLELIEECIEIFKEEIPWKFIKDE